jgi:signal peptidase I
VPARLAPLPDSVRRRHRASRRGDLRFVIAVALMALVLRSFVAMPRNIPSESMMPRLVVGDYLVVAKWPYGWSRFSLPWAPPAPHGRLFGRAPQRGDIIVFRAPPEEKADYIKRLIGLPGDRIAMKGGQLWINGAAVPKVRETDFILPMTDNTQCSSIPTIASPYGAGALPDGQPVCRFRRYRETLPGGASYDVLDQGDTPQDDTDTFIVPAGHYFLMGDNRDMSEDSRFAPREGGIGMVPADNLEGRAIFTFFSTNGAARWHDPLSWVRAMRADRVGMAL